MRHWNYRVLRHSDGTLAIHEVHYEDVDRPTGCTVNPASFVGDDVAELRRVLELATCALDEEVLDFATVVSPT